MNDNSKLHLHEKISDSLISIDKNTNMWKSRFGVAKAAYETGEFRQCEALLHLELNLAEQIEESTFATNATYIALAALYSEMGKSAKATDFIQKAIGHLAGQSEPTLVELFAVALRVKSYVNLDQSDFENAERMLREAISLLRKLGSNYSLQLGYALRDLAILLLEQGNLEEAQLLLQESAQKLTMVLDEDDNRCVEIKLMYETCAVDDGTDILQRMEDCLFRLQYYLGYHHPHIRRAFRSYIHKRQQRGEYQQVVEAKARFSLLVSEMQL